jgi:cell division initiation protein
LKLNSNSIRNQVFTQKFFGFSKEEVKEYLNLLADGVEVLIKENDEMKKQINELYEQIESYKKIESNLQQTLLKAQESSSKSLESTRKQTQVMLMEAEVKANQIIENAKLKAKKINDAINNLQEEKNLIISKLESILMTQIRILEPELNIDSSKTTEENLNQVSFLKIDIEKILESLENE